MINFDIDALLDQCARRERALQGSQHVPTGYGRSTVNAGPRPDAVSPLDRPELLWPSERNKLPRRCWNCQAGSAHFDYGDAPYGLQKTGTVTCVTCSHVVVRLKADGIRPVVLPPDPGPKRGRPPVGIAAPAPPVKRTEREIPPLPDDHPIWTLLNRLEPRGQRVSATDLRIALGGWTYEQMRTLIKFARRRGYSITGERHQGYVLEGSL